MPLMPDSSRGEYLPCLRPREAPLYSEGAGRFWSKVSNVGSSGCWEWSASRNPKGYGRFTFRGRKYVASRFAMLLQGENIEGLQVCHKCDNPSCVRPDHLFTGTMKDNYEDMKSKCRWSRAATLLSCEDIQLIKDLKQAGWYQREIAKEFGLSQPYVSQILSGARL